LAITRFCLLAHPASTTWRKHFQGAAAPESPRRREPQGGETVASTTMSDDLKLASTVTSGAEAEMVCERLRGAGIHAIIQRTIGGPEWGSSGARDVFVRAEDHDRARELLAAEEGSFSDEELGRLSEEAAREATERDD
jgi:hypothetical protein